MLPFSSRCCVEEGSVCETVSLSILASSSHHLYVASPIFFVPHPPLPLFICSFKVYYLFLSLASPLLTYQMMGPLRWPQFPLLCILSQQQRKLVLTPSPCLHQVTSWWLSHDLNLACRVSSNWLPRRIATARLHWASVCSNTSLRLKWTTWLDIPDQYKQTDRTEWAEWLFVGSKIVLFEDLLIEENGENDSLCIYTDQIIWVILR
jgi:hypothetical protein